MHHGAQHVLAREPDHRRTAQPGPVIISTSAALVSIQALSPESWADFAALSSALRRSSKVGRCWADCENAWLPPSRMYRIGSHDFLVITRQGIKQGEVQFERIAAEDLLCSDKTYRGEDS